MQQLMNKYYAPDPEEEEEDDDVFLFI